MKFTQTQIETLRAEYSKAPKRMDPDSPALAKLRNFVDGLPVDQAIQLRDSGIPWVSSLICARFARSGEARAERQGMESFERGAAAVPALDPSLRQDISNGGGTALLCAAWLRGWHSANLRSPVK
jgi:hypothetical protein